MADQTFGDARDENSMSSDGRYRVSDRDADRRHTSAYMELCDVRLFSDISFRRQLLAKLIAYRYIYMGGIGASDDC